MYAIRSYYGMPEHAETSLRRALDLDPADGEAHLFLGRVLVERAEGGQPAARPRITSYNVCYTKLLRR